MIMRG